MEKFLCQPSSESDRTISDCIKNYPDGNYENEIKNSKELEIIKHLSAIPRGIISWYPFRQNSNILQINGGFGNISVQLLNYCNTLTVTESNLFRLNCMKERLKSFENIRFSDKIVYDKYDYIVYIADEFSETITDIDLLKKLKLMLNNNGTLLFAVYNPMGTHFLCGDTFSDLLPFETIDGNNKCLLCRCDAEKIIKSSGFKNYKIYYPFPDHVTPELIYTGECSPNDEIKERLIVYIKNTYTRVIKEENLIFNMVKEKSLLPFANSFLFECTDGECSDIIYAALSSKRCRERAFNTIIRKNKVEKIPMYPEGQQGIDILLENCKNLKARNIPVIDIKSNHNKAIMDKIEFPTLATVLKTMCRNKEKFINMIDILYKYILNSSEYADKSENIMLDYAPNEEWGIILKKAYIEMIPVNCFYKDDGELLFFDQEYTMDNCPAIFVLFRGIRDIYKFHPETENYVSLESLKKRYNLDKFWKYFEMEEIKFGDKLNQQEIYRNFVNKHYSEDRNTVLILNNRRMLKMNAEKNYRLLNPVSDLENEKIILFGSGWYCDYYMNKYGKEYPPSLIIDNNSEKWGQMKYNVPIKSPEAIKEFIYGTYRIIVTIADYFPVIRQLNQMGIGEKYYRVYNKDIDNMLNLSIADTLSEDKYNIGYVTGAFDLFHIGHLNILKRSKERCHYLIAGVLTDEIVINEKFKHPFIPFEERIEIVRQCKFVDRAIAIDSHNTNKLDAWKELKFGCLFAGSDHQEEGYWLNLRNQLIALGSNLEFFPYTHSTSSTMLQKAIGEFNKE